MKCNKTVLMFLPDQTFILQPCYWSVFGWKSSRPALPEVFWLCLACSTGTCRLMNPCFHTGTRVCEAVRNVRRPPCASCDTRWLTGFLSSVVVSLSENPFRFWSKKSARVADLAAPRAGLDLWSQQSHEIKFWGQERSVSVVIRLKSAIYCNISN